MPTARCSPRGSSAKTSRNSSADSLDALLIWARQNLSLAPDAKLPTWNYIWDLILANPAQLAEDFRAAGQSGIDSEARVEEPVAIRGSRSDIFVGRGAKIHPMVVLDAEHGPIYIDEDVEIHPFTRIEGPCYIGRKSILLGAKCREGNSIGPMCRIGGEVEESIIQGYSNKYHDGFLGHAYVGQWVNLGALTTNSDLKNDYSEVKITLDGRTQLSTGSTKVGALIGDHTKTSIGTLLNTGTYVGAMTLLVTSGKLLPKFIPSFTWYLNDAITPRHRQGRRFTPPPARRWGGGNASGPRPTRRCGTPSMKSPRKNGRRLSKDIDGRLRNEIRKPKIGIPEQIRI